MKAKRKYGVVVVDQEVASDGDCGHYFSRGTLVKLESDPYALSDEGYKAPKENWFIDAEKILAGVKPNVASFQVLRVRDLLIFEA